MPPALAMPRAERAANRALELDPHSGDALAALAMVEWRWRLSPKARVLFESALDKQPYSSAIRLLYAWFLLSGAHLAGALEQIRIAEELDPLSAFIRANHAWLLYFARDFRGAVLAGQTARELDAEFPLACLPPGYAHLAMGGFGDAIRAFRAGRRAAGSGPFYEASLGVALAKAGRSKEAPSPSYCRALVHLGLNQMVAFYDAVDEAVAERSSYVLYLGVDPLFDALRSDSRFQTLLQSAAVNISAIQS